MRTGCSSSGRRLRDRVARIPGASRVIFADGGPALPDAVAALRAIFPRLQTRPPGAIRTTETDVTNRASSTRPAFIKRRASR